MARTIKKVLVANRGEIAIRVMRTLRDMGIRSVAIFSDVDRNSLHVQMADESICIGPRSVKDSYLNKVQIINAALVTGADAIHPGFGFLSENESFARLCEIYDIKFIGPSSKLIGLLGDKEEAKRVMKAAGLPTIEGSDSVVESLEVAREVCDKIKYPVIIKARSGGGGKGMRMVKSECELESAFISARKEAENSFGDKEVYIEKFIEEPRHIEVQILADEHGNVVHLGSRDCSIQMNHQKVIEEAPATSISQTISEYIYEMSVRAARHLGYTNAGTIEFLVDKNSNVYFMEMNTRIQVEHPVTELITGIDIVRAQVEIAGQEKLKFSQEDINFNGHSIECRINAYDEDRNFIPSVGTIEAINIPGGFGVRIDSAIYQGYEVLPFYDSMLAKVVVHGGDRKNAINIMKRALGEMVIDGIKTNINFNRKIMNDEVFVDNTHTTGFLEERNEV